jgi:hypothetical protein
MFSAELSRRVVALGLAASLGGATLAGCGVNSSEEIAKMSAVERFAHDYAEDPAKAFDSIGSSCFTASIYDPGAPHWAPGGERSPLRTASVTISEDGKIVVEPGLHYQHDHPTLTFEKPDDEGDKPLQPADEQTRRVLEEGGCPTEYEKPWWERSFDRPSPRVDNVRP